jgi:hypothetical protein
MATHPIRFGIQTGQQNIEWAQMLDLLQKAEGWGYASLRNFLPPELPSWRPGPRSPRSRRRRSARASAPSRTVANANQGLSVIKSDDLTIEGRTFDVRSTIPTRTTIGTDSGAAYAARRASGCRGNERG